MQKTLYFIFFLFLIVSIPNTLSKASNVKIQNDDFRETSLHYSNFFGPKFFFVNDYPSYKNINDYLKEVFYLGVISKEKVKEFSNPSELYTYITNNFSSYHQRFYKKYEYVSDENNNLTDRINKVSYMLNNDIYYTVDFIKTTNIPKPSIEGPKLVAYNKGLSSLNDLYSLFNFYSPLNEEELYKPKLYKLFDKTELFVSNLAKITSDEGDYVIKKYFLGYGEVALQIKLVKEENHIKDIIKINNDIVISLLNTRPTEDTLLSLYKEKLNKLGLYPENLTINHSTYSKFDKTDNDDFMLVGYKLNNIEYEDKFIITKNSLKKDNKILRYNLYITAIIGILILILTIFPIVKRIIVKSNLKRKSKKNSR